MFWLKSLRMEKVINVLKVWFIPISISLFFTLECINGIYFFLVESSSSLSLSFPIKLLWEIGIILLLLWQVKSIENRYKVFLGFVIVSFVVGFFRFSNDLILMIHGLKHYNKLFIFLIVYIFLDLYRPKLGKGLRLLDYVFVLNSALIIIGLLAGIQFLRSYPYTERFGYSGVFCRYSINDVSLFYLIGNFYMLYRWKQGNVALWLFAFVFIASFLVGTKAIYLQNALLMLYIVFRVKELSKYIIVLGVISFSILLCYYNFSFWEDIIEQRGLLSAITSLRSDLLVSKVPLVIENLSIWSTLYGLNNPFQYFVEMDLVDLVFAFGIVGSGLLGYFYGNILFRFKKEDHFAWMFIIVYILLACISGRYTYSGVNALYFPLFLYYLKKNE